jgi:alpha-tubulin suppressor-like RCC1 family protein
MITCGGDDTFATTENGMVVSFGGNASGQLGRPESENEYWMNTRCINDKGEVCSIRQVSCGTEHTGLVTCDGDLFMCGSGRFGQLGLGDERNQATPTRVARAVFDDEAVLMVACGEQHTVVATEGGGVYTFGDGAYGRLGHGDYEKKLTPRRVSAVAFRPKGSAEGPGERIVMVAAGDSHTVALSEAGHVFTWGWGDLGQLGHNDESNQRAPRQVEPGRFDGESVVFVAAGGYHTVAVTAGGRLYTWGYGCYGQLGHGDTGNSLVPTVVGAGAFGAPEGGRVVMAACGSWHTLVVTQEGALWACGLGCKGQLGLNDTDSRHAFERVGAEVFGGARVVAAAAGEAHSAAVTEDGALWTWGSGHRGRLGHGDGNQEPLPNKVTTVTIEAPMFGKSGNLSREMNNVDALVINRMLRESNPSFIQFELTKRISEGAQDPWEKKLNRLPGLRRLLGERPPAQPSSTHQAHILTAVCQRCQIQASSA